MWKIDKIKGKIGLIFVQIKGLTKKKKRDIITKLSHKIESCRKNEIEPVSHYI